MPNPISRYLIARRNKKRHAARLIFHFWDGTDERGADPMELLQRAAMHPTFRAEKHYEMVVKPPEIPENAPDHEREFTAREWDEAYRITCQAARDIFEIPVFRELNGIREGLTNDELIALLGTLAEYVTRVKKNGRGGPTPPSNSVASPLSPPTSETTSSASSASGSTAPEPEPAEVSAS